MASRFQAAVLVATSSHPNSVAWSAENLLAIASGHIVTILNPSSPSQARGLITIQAREPYPIGRVKREDLLTDRLLPIALSRDRHPCVRSISWSQLGMASNYGCLLAICTTEGCVKLFGPPFCDFHADWVEVADISDNLYVLAMSNLWDLNAPSNSTTNFNSTCSKIENNKLGSSLPLITAEQYASRSAMLSSLIIAWLPMLWSSSKTCSQTGCCRFSILAVGGKCGDISFWRINAPKSYSIEASEFPACVMHVGLVHAHNSWISAISIASCGFGCEKIVLASGSSDGSVKIWLIDSMKFLQSCLGDNAFTLLGTISSDDHIPISVLQVAIPVQSHQICLLAIGRGSGCLEVGRYDIPGRTFNKDVCHAHDYVVTGLAWAFNGRVLYSCGQDNYIRSWILHGSSLSEVPIPSSITETSSPTNIPDVCVACQGIVASPGNLLVAVVRNLIFDELDHMYEARVQKAVVEFIWIGGHQLDASRNHSSEFATDIVVHDLSAVELTCWEANILSALRKYESSDEPLVVWDIIQALAAFRHARPKYFDCLLLKWLSATYLDSSILPSDSNVDACARLSPSVAKISTRKLHLLNVIHRRVILSESDGNGANSEGDPHGLWEELLWSSERELRERLVSFTFYAYMNTRSHHPGNWHPVGVEQMERWVAHDCHRLGDGIKVLASEVRKNYQQGHGAEELCSYCSESVPFDSPEVAFCRSSNVAAAKHKLLRCSVSMRICPVVAPLWHCKCCCRWASRLAPEAFFRMSSSFCPTDLESLMEENSATPFCPFCGILLQRFLPDFLLSASPV